MPILRPQASDHEADWPVLHRGPGKRGNFYISGDSGRDVIPALKPANARCLVDSFSPFPQRAYTATPRGVRSLLFPSVPNGQWTPVSLVASAVPTQETPVKRHQKPHRRNMQCRCDFSTSGPNQFEVAVRTTDLSFHCALEFDS